MNRIKKITSILMMMLLSGIMMGTIVHASFPYRTNLSAYYTFDTDFNDSTLLNNGTDSTHVSLQSGGIIGKYLQVNSGWLNLTNDSSLNFGAGAYTVNFWFQPNSSAQQTVFGKFNYVTTATGIYFRLLTNQTMEPTEYNAGAASMIDGNKTGIQAGVWTMITVTYNDSTNNMTLYTNGTYLTSAIITNRDVTSASKMAIGIWQWTAGPDLLNAKIDEMGFWKQRSLTYQEVQSLYSVYQNGSNAWNYTGIPNVPTGANLTLFVNDTRTGNNIAGFSWNYTTTNASDTGAKSGVCPGTFCSITNFTGTINVTIFNVSNGTYFNPYDSPVLNLFYNVTAGKNLTVNTYSNSINITSINDNITLGNQTFCIQIGNSTTWQNQCTNGNTSAIVYQISGNLSFNITNISNNTYYNLTGSYTNFNATVTYNNYSAQNILIITALQLFTNQTISTFNLTNNKTTNNTPNNNQTTIYGFTGANNLKIDVAGNYSTNITCTPTTPTTTVFCNATGIYDNQFTIGATFNGAGIGTFNVSVNNTNLGATLYNTQTTNGSILFMLLQGYTYTFVINPPAYSINNASLPANATTNLYNFTVLQQNSFELHFYNETTDAPFTNTSGNITVQLISTAYAQNYTTSNGTLLVTLLTPAAYTITYWMDPTVPRNYYITLTNQSYDNLTLYIIDTGISSTYLPIVNNEYTRPLSGVTVSLLRAFIENNVYTYHTVEMETTDTNGQAVLRVVPNYINYKLLLSYGTASVTTAPTKFTANTNAYTLSLSQNALTSITEMPSVSKSLTFNNATKTYTFTWADTQNLITSGCMNVQKYNSSGTFTVQNSCSNGGTGSIIYTITDTNNTRYSASATLNTNTQYSTYFFGPLGVDFTNTATSIFGLTGLILLSILLVTVGFMANENGTDSLIITTLIGMVLFGVVGIVFYTWEAYIGIIILGIIYIYKTNG